MRLFRLFFRPSEGSCGLFWGSFVGVLVCFGGGVCSVPLGAVTFSCFVTRLALFCGKMAVMRACAWCGKRLVERGTGRPARFCSGRCRVAAHRGRSPLPGVPVEMSGRARWVRRDGKRPLTVEGGAASSTDASTWSTLPAVLASEVGDGVGFMLGDGFACIDLDHCLSGGVLSPLASSVLEALPATYVEVSMSGTGLHVFGLLPEMVGVRRPGFEVYSRARFIAVTGRPFEDSRPQLADLSAVADALIHC